MKKLSVPVCGAGGFLFSQMLWIQHSGRETWLSGEKFFSDLDINFL